MPQNRQQHHTKINNLSEDCLPVENILNFFSSWMFFFYFFFILFYCTNYSFDDVALHNDDDDDVDGCYVCNERTYGFFFSERLGIRRY